MPSISEIFPVSPPEGSIDGRVIRLTLEYDGTDFCGWQQNPGVRTAQGVLVETVRALTREPQLMVFGASRTDSGVHALGQVASFVTQGRIPVQGMLRGLNTHLPPDLSVVAAAEAPAGFQARHSARGKRYRYLLLDRPVRSPRLARYSWHQPRPLDVRAMAEGAALLTGSHDFSAFRGVGCTARSTHKTLHRITVTERGATGLVAVEVVGDAFLKYMVRNIVGTLVQVGLGRRPPGWVGEALASLDRGHAGPTAPPQGLTLVEVFYEEGAAARA